MADKPDASDDGWWSKLAGFAREVHSITDPNVMYGKMYNQYLSHTDDPEKAAELARRGTDMVSSSMGRNKAIWTGMGYMHPVTAPAMIVNQIQEAANAETPGEAATAGATAIAPNVAGKSVRAPTMARGATSGAPVAAPGYADGGDVSKALSVVPQAPEADPVGVAKSVMAQPRPVMSKGQQRLMQTFQEENRPAAVVSPKPGTGSTEDSPGWSFATPNIEGADKPPPMQAPTQNEPRLSNIAAHVQKQMKTKGFRDLVRDVAGIHSMDVTPTTGSWLGKVEPSFIINGYGPNGEDATPEQIRKLSHLLGFGYQQDAVVEHHHNPNLEEGVPTMYVGKGSKLGKADLDRIHATAQDHGLDFTRTKDGMGVKFSHFGEEAELPEFIQKVQSFAQKANMPDILGVKTSGDLKYAKGYLDEIFREHAVPSGAADGSARSPDLFRRVVDHILAPYAKAAAAEGYRLSPERLGEAYGLSKEEINHVRNALLPGQKVDRSTVPLMEGSETLDVRPTGARGEANVDDVIYALANRAATSGQIDPNDFSDPAKKKIAESIADEVNYHANNSDKSAIGWYDNALKRAKGEYHKIFPELATDQNSEQLFNSILGITSQGADVHTNSKNAARVYDMVRNGASISDAVDSLKGTFGKETRAIEFNLKKYESLLEKLGPEKMQELFNKKMPKKEWDKFIKDNDFMVDHNGAPLTTKGGANQKITGWSVFGPKIGSFMNNLNGDYSTLTADLWFTRTWNRLLGHSFLHQPTQEAAQYRNFRDALKAEYYKDTGNLAPAGKEIIPEGKTAQGKLKISPKTGKPEQWLHGNDAQELSHDDFQRLMDNPDDLLEYAKDIHTRYVKSGYKDKSDMRRRAKNWIENRFNAAAAPRGDKERNFQQDTVEEAQKVLKKKYGLDVSVADIQAALWFHEKELFGKHGVASTRAEPADYYDAAHQTVADHQNKALFKTLKEDRAASKIAAKAAKEEAEDREDFEGETPR